MGSKATVSCTVDPTMDIQDCLRLANKVADEIYPDHPKGFETVTQSIMLGLEDAKRFKIPIQCRWTLEGQKVVDLTWIGVYTPIPKAVKA